MAFLPGYMLLALNILTRFTFRLSLASVVASIVLFILNPLINLNITFIISVISCTYIILLTVVPCRSQRISIF